MAPISPVSQKRSSSHSDDEMPDKHLSKRARTESAGPYTPPPDEDVGAAAVMSDHFDDSPRQLLKRSVALTLEHVGFAGASPEAIEALCAEADEYATQFLSQITSAMLNARRSLPIPLDFEYGLQQFALPIASLEPHLKPPIPRSKTILRLERAPANESELLPVTRLLGSELNGETDKNDRQYIPKRFPSFPSKHTYRWTEKESRRQTDARKIREEASVQARQGEDALRRLTTVSKAGQEKGVKQTAGRDPKSKERHHLWEQAMGALQTANLVQAPGVGAVDRSMIVNANKAYHRKGIMARKKKAVQPPDLFDLI